MTAAIPTYDELLARVAQLEQQNSEQAKTLEATFQSFFRKHDAVMLLMTGEGRLVDGNDAALRFYGYSLAEIKSMRICDINQLPSAELAVELQRAVRGDRKFFIFPHRLKSGEIRTVETHTTSITIEHETFLFSVIFDITERKGAEEALRESEQRYRALFDGSLELVYIHDFEGCFIDANNQALSLLGYERDEIRDIQFADLLNAEALPQAMETAREIFQDGRTLKTREYELHGKDGKTVWVETSGVRLDKDGEPFGIMGIARNITERRRAEEALRQSEAKHRAMTANISDVIGVMRADGVMTFKSANITKWFGWQPENLVGTDGWLTVHPDDLERIQGEFALVLAEPSAPRRVEYRYKCKDGSYKSIELTAVDMTKDPLIGGVLLNYRDITDRKQAEEKLRRVSDELLKIGRMALVGGWSVDLKPEKHEWSEVTRDIHEVGPDFIPDFESAISFYKEGESRRIINDVVAQCMETGKSYDVDVQIVTAKGRECWVRTMGTADFQDGRCVRLHGTFQDITERKRAEQRHRQLETQLLQSQKMEAIGTLAGGVAHDMNNVLAVVLGLGSVLEKEMGPDDPKTYDIQEIVAAAQRGKSLVEKLLGFARKGKYHKQNVSLNDTVRGLVEVLGHSISKKVVINTQLDDQLERVVCDATQLYQVVMNLCVNASDALAGKGTITLSTSNQVLGAGDVVGLGPGPYVLLQVKDNGPGMDEETRKKAFEPFFTTKDVGKGTGLGLSMAYGVIKNHGGAILIDSSPGAGTAINIWLPAVEPDEAKEAKEALRPSLGERKAKVLLVDDEELIRKMGRRMLEANGYEVIAVDGGLSAVELYRDKRDEIDLVLLDLSMPVMDGAECFAKLKEIDPNVRVVICTGHGSPGDTNQMVRNGALGVVKKPFDLAQLSEALAGAIGDSWNAEPSERPEDVQNSSG